MSRTVADVIAAVRSRADDAVREYSERFDHWTPESFQLTAEEIAAAVARVPEQVLDDIRSVQQQVRTMAERQLASLTEFEIETLPGVHLGQKNIPISASAAYVPGGRYPMLASAHMTIVTARVAGVARVSAATPPVAGAISDTMVAGMALAGADEIYILGGVQAIAALAVGTAMIGKVDLIAGPGNGFVAEAKRQLYGEVGIDLLAGPTEILMVADDVADPFLTAVDLLSRAEHGPDSPAVLVTTSEDLGRAVLQQIEALLPLMPTRDSARHSGGLRVGKFLRTVTYQEVTDTDSSVRVAEVTRRAARVEHFEGARLVGRCSHRQIPGRGIRLDRRGAIRSLATTRSEPPGRNRSAPQLSADSGLRVGLCKRTGSAGDTYSGDHAGTGTGANQIRVGARLSRFST